MKSISACIDNFAKGVLIPQVYKEMNEIGGLEALSRLLNDNDRAKLLSLKDHLNVTVDTKKGYEVTFTVHVADTVTLGDYKELVTMFMNRLQAYRFDNDGRGVFYDAKQYGDTFVNSLEELEKYEPYLKDKLSDVTIRLLAEVTGMSNVPGEFSVNVEFVVQSPTYHKAVKAAA